MTIEDHNKRKLKKAGRKTQREQSDLEFRARYETVTKASISFLVTPPEIPAAFNSIIETIPMKGATIVADERRGRAREIQFFSFPRLLSSFRSLPNSDKY